MRKITHLLLGLTFTAVAAGIAVPVRSQDTAWRISKITGQAWVTGAGSELAALTPALALKPGDSIRTGRNGRVLLTRGAETMLVSPNTAVTLPRPEQYGLSTVIQQAGTILLDVEKRNVQHFEVETPLSGSCRQRHSLLGHCVRWQGAGPCPTRPGPGR